MPTYLSHFFIPLCWDHKQKTKIKLSCRFSVQTSKCFCYAFFRFSMLVQSSFVNHRKPSCLQQCVQNDIFHSEMPIRFLLKGIFPRHIDLFLIITSRLSKDIILELIFSNRRTVCKVVILKCLIQSNIFKWENIFCQSKYLIN